MPMCTFQEFLALIHTNTTSHTILVPFMTMTLSSNYIISSFDFVMTTADQTIFWTFQLQLLHRKIQASKQSTHSPMPRTSTQLIKDWHTYNSDEIHWKLCPIARLPLQVQPLSQPFLGSHSHAFLFEVIQWAYFKQ